MPFVSQAQRGYLYIHHPKIAKEFESVTPKGKKLPYHVKKKTGAAKKVANHHSAIMNGLRKYGNPA